MRCGSCGENCGGDEKITRVMESSGDNTDGVEKIRTVVVEVSAII